MVPEASFYGIYRNVSPPPLGAQQLLRKKCIKKKKRGVSGFY